MKKRVNYREYIKSDIWKAQSLERRNEAGRCSLCGNRSRRLVAHHNTYRNLGDEKYQDITILCSFCHSNFHRTHRYSKKTHSFYRFK